MSTHWWALVFACAAVVACIVAGLAWRRRGRTPAATALAVTMLAVATWSTADAVVYSVASDAVRRVFPAVLMASVGLVVVGTYGLARTVADPSWRLARRAALLLAVEPVVLVVVASLPATRDLVLSIPSVAVAPTRAKVGLGPAFAAHTAYSYVLVSLAYLHLARRWRKVTGVFRRQVGVLLGSAALCSVGNILVIAAQSGGAEGVDLTPICFLVTGLIDCWALLCLGLLKLVPVAREQIVDTVPDAVIVLDPEGLIIDVNPVAVRLLGGQRPGSGPLVGRPLREVAGPRAVDVLDRTEHRDGHRVAEVAPGLWLDVRDSAVSDPGGRPLGRIIVARDVTEQQQRQEAVERLNRQLAEQVQVIEGLRATLAEEAIRDPLTGLHNRRHLDRVLAAELAARPRAGESSVLIVDIDHFKAVNDRFGHGAGDQVLCALGRTLQDAVRVGDTVARLGGEEFVLVLPGAGREQAVERAEQLRRAVSAASHELDGDCLQVTVSIGVAVCPHDGSSAEALLEAADRALYTAKATGRDRVAAAMPEDAEAGVLAVVPAVAEPRVPVH